MFYIKEKTGIQDIKVVNKLSPSNRMHLNVILV